MKNFIYVIYSIVIGMSLNAMATTDVIKTLQSEFKSGRAPTEQELSGTWNNCAVFVAGTGATDDPACRSDLGQNPTLSFIHKDSFYMASPSPWGMKDSQPWLMMAHRELEGHIGHYSQAANGGSNAIAYRAFRVSQEGRLILENSWTVETGIFCNRFKPGYPLEITADGKEGKQAGALVFEYITCDSISLN